MTYQQLDWLTMESSLTLSAADSLAKTSASLGKAPDSLVSDQDFGGNTTASSRKRGPPGSLRKTYQFFALADWTMYSGALLRSGMTRNGTVYPLQPLALLTKGTAFGLLPTPNAGLGKHSTKTPYWENRIAKKRQKDIQMAIYLETGSGALNPTWVEWLMGFPIGWTDLKHSETP